MGLGDTATRFAPTRIPYFDEKFAMGVVVGESHSCVWDIYGAGYCFGTNYVGMLGTGDTTQRKTPALVTGMTNHVIVQMSAGKSSH